MYFKALELQGFKSFAEKIRLEFTPGITGIVGPNGSGKSNISDAIKWVMGEMSVKSLRGNKMEDVIFAGTEKRNPVGFCEVTIVMDNEDRALKVDYGEVSVTRRVHRSGESEYFINKSCCRLKDIYELFMDTGLGRDGYSIVGQGMIDNIITAKSTDRRYIFDEAAGITKYRYRKDETTKKLEAAKENLLRVDDILTELTQRVGPLQTQSEKAKKYLLLRDEKRSLEVNLWLVQIEKHRELLEDMHSSYEIAKEQSDKAHNEIKALELQIVRLKADLRILEGEIDESMAQLYHVGSEKQREENEIELLENNISNTFTNAEKLKGRMSLASERQAVSGDFILQLEEEVAQIKQKQMDIEEEIQNKKTLLKTMEDKFSQQSSMENEMKESAASKLNSIIFNTSKKEGIVRLLQNIEDNISSNAEKYRARKEKLQEVTEKEIAVKRQLEEAEYEIGQKQAEYEQKNNAIVLLEQKASALSKKSEEAQALEKSLLSKKRMLEDLENEFDGYSKSVKALMQAHQASQLSGAHIHGPLSTLLQVDPRYVTAIEAALGPAMQNIVTDAQEDAKIAIAYLKSNALGRATFLPIAAMRGKTQDYGVKNEKGYVAVACEIVACDSQYRSIVDYLLGRTVIAEHIDSAIAMAKRHNHQFRIVTLQGELINAGGSITGGSIQFTGSLSRRAQIEEIAKEIKAIGKEKPHLATEVEEVYEKLAEEKRIFERTNLSLWEIKNAIASHIAQLAGLSDMKASAQAELFSIEKEVATYQEQKEQSRLATEEIDAQNLALEIELNNSRNQSDLHMVDAQKMEDEMKNTNEQILNISIALSSYMKDIELRMLRMEDAKREFANLGAECMLLNKEGDELQRLIQTAEQDIAEKKQKKQDLEEKTEQIRIDTESKKNAKELLQSKIEEKENHAKLLTEDSFILQSQFGKIDAKKVRIEAELEAVIGKLWDEYELTYITAVELRKCLESDALSQKRLSELKNEIKALGNINIDAIEEYKVVKERYEFLSTQREDLENSRSALLKMIEEITSLMTALFEENFAQLNIFFSQTFAQLFGGGSAKLRLSDPENVLESGVEIDVQPPGKKLQSITLLSGGEKALTAISLLFAILKLQPTHFCIFDEIDAALDDVNVLKYATYLKNLSECTQFIIITHRKHTMEAADMLYGVTMQEKGVSTLLSLDMGKI